MRIAVRGWSHTMAKIDDFESDLGGFLTETDLGGGAAGMALNVGEALLNDAEQSDLEGLREAVELREKEELGIDAAALAEALGVFLEGGNEAKVVKERRMEKVGEGTNFAGHLLGERTSLFQGESGGSIVGR